MANTTVSIRERIKTDGRWGGMKTDANGEMVLVVVNANKIVEVDFTADNPGNTLFHCHQ